MDALNTILNLISEKFPSDRAFESAANLKPKTVDSWKRGNSKSYLKMLPKLSNMFNVSIDYLFGNPTTTELPQQDIEKTRRIETLFAEKGLPFDDKTVSLFLDFVAANAEIIKRQMGENK